MDNNNIGTAEVDNNRNENENEILIIQKKKILKIINILNILKNRLQNIILTENNSINILNILKNRLENMIPIEDNPSTTNTTDIAQRENNI